MDAIFPFCAEAAHLVRFWDVESGKFLRQLAGVNEAVEHLGFYGERNEMVMGFSNGMIWFWDMVLLEPIAKIEDVVGDIQTLSFKDENLIAVINNDGGMIRLWKITH